MKFRQLRGVVVFWFLYLLVSCSNDEIITPKQLQIKQIEVKINKLEAKKDSILNPDYDF